VIDPRTHPESRPGKRKKWSTRRTLATVAIVLLCTVIGIHLGRTVSEVYGTPPGEVTDRGVAEVSSCARNWIRAGLLYRCQATVRWDDDQDAEPARVSVNAYEPLRGELRVVERTHNCGGPRGRCIYDVWPADLPDRPNLAWFAYVMAVVSPVAGLLLAMRVTRRLDPTSA